MIETRNKIISALKAEQREMTAAELGDKLFLAHDTVRRHLALLRQSQHPCLKFGRMKALTGWVGSCKYEEADDHRGSRKVEGR